MRDSPDSNRAAVTMAPTIGIAAAVVVVVVACLVLLLLSFILLSEFINVSEMIWNLTISVQLLHPQQ
jgi:hypothetical protein